ncbi:hypothetical protein DFH06DRAFT_596141 [Mycena polygramma]|nr:hypothetical protein DFH06DRAFT_596141 [Mycena polygramma]
MLVPIPGSPSLDARSANCLPGTSSRSIRVERGRVRRAAVLAPTHWDGRPRTQRWRPSTSPRSIPVESVALGRVRLRAVLDRHIVMDLAGPARAAPTVFHVAASGVVVLVPTTHRHAPPSTCPRWRSCVCQPWFAASGGGVRGNARCWCRCAYARMRVAVMKEHSQACAADVDADAGRWGKGGRGSSQSKRTRIGNVLRMCAPNNLLLPNPSHPFPFPFPFPFPSPRLPISLNLFPLPPPALVVPPQSPPLPPSRFELCVRGEVEGETEKGVDG